MKLQQFIGSEAEFTYDEAKVIILAIPDEKTTTYHKGCQNTGFFFPRRDRQYNQI